MTNSIEYQVWKHGAMQSWHLFSRHQTLCEADKVVAEEKAVRPHLLYEVRMGRPFEEELAEVLAKADAKQVAQAILDIFKWEDCDYISKKVAGPRNGREAWPSTSSPR